MVSAKELEVIKSYVRRAVKSRVMAMDFVKAQGEDVSLKVTTSRLKLAFNALYLLTNGAMVLNAGNRLYRIFIQHSYTASLPLQVTYMFMLVCPIFIFSLNEGFAAQRENLVPLYNQLIGISARIGSQRATRRGKYLEILHKGFTFTAFVGTIAIAGTELKYVLDSRIALHCGLALAWAWAVVLVFMLYCAYTIFGLVQMLIFLYFALVHDVLREGEEENSENEEDCKPQSKSVREEIQIQNYRALSIICTLFNTSYCRTLVPAIKYLPSLLIMTCFHCAIRLHGSDPMTITVRVALFIVGVYLWVMLIVGADMTSGLWSKSSEFIWKIRTQGNVDLIEDEGKDDNTGAKYAYAARVRVARSFAPLRFGVAGIYYMEKRAKLTLMNFIVTGIVNLLLAFPPNE